MDITGKVINRSGQGEPYVKVFPSTLEGKPLSTSVGAVTDLDGKFSLKIPESLGAKYINARTLEGDSVQKLSSTETNYEINIGYKQSQTLPEVTVTAVSSATKCSNEGGVWDAVNKKCNMPEIKPKIETKKINWKKVWIIGGISLVALGVAGYFIAKRLKK